MRFLVIVIIIVVVLVLLGVVGGVVGWSVMKKKKGPEVPIQDPNLPPNPTVNLVTSPGKRWALFKEQVWYFDSGSSTTMDKVTGLPSDSKWVQQPSPNGVAADLWVDLKASNDGLQVVAAKKPNPVPTNTVFINYDQWFRTGITATALKGTGWTSTGAVTSSLLLATGDLWGINSGSAVYRRTFSATTNAWLTGWTQITVPVGVVAKPDSAQLSKTNTFAFINTGATNNGSIFAWNGTAFVKQV
jgi:hypothetical protein